MWRWKKSTSTIKGTVTTAEAAAIFLARARLENEQLQRGLQDRNGRL